MNMEIQNKVYSYLYPQYEQAKIEEIKNLPTIEVIDKAVPSGLRSKPRRAMMCIITFFIALSASILMSIIIEVYSSKGVKNKISNLRDELIKH